MKNQFTTSRDFFRAFKNTVFMYENKWKQHTTMLLHGSQTVDKTAKALEIVSKLSGQAVYINASNAIDNDKTSSASRPDRDGFPSRAEAVSMPGGAYRRS